MNKISIRISLRTAQGILILILPQLAHVSMIVLLIAHCTICRFADGGCKKLVSENAFKCEIETYPCVVGDADEWGGSTLCYRKEVVVGGCCLLSLVTECKTCRRSQEKGGKFY